jgi:hypothetical protein
MATIAGGNEMRRDFRLVFCAMFLACVFPVRLYADDAAFRDPRPVSIDNLPPGHGGTPISTEEPFVSRDGRFLFFNTGEQENNKDLHFAEWQSGRWRYRGEIGPQANTPGKVEGNPSMDATNNFFYIDADIRTMARVSRFDPRSGEIGEIAEVTGIPERVIKLFRSFQGNMGVEVSADGQYLYFSRATWQMNGFWLGTFIDSDILFSQKHNGQYVYDETQAKAVMKNINTADMEYAASISADGLELFFTRLPIDDLRKGKVHSQIMRAARSSLSEPFSAPESIIAIGSDDFVEGPSLSPDGTELYYHKREGDKSRLYKVSRNR